MIAAQNVFGRDVIPRAAALLGIQPITNVSSIEGDASDGKAPFSTIIVHDSSSNILTLVVFTRPIYAGNAIMTVQSTEAIKFLTIRAASFSAIEAQDTTHVPIQEASEAEEPARASEWVSEEIIKSERPDLGIASRVVSGGRGLRSKEDFDNLMVPLADSLGAAIGASRAAVDNGYADNSLQVGQTGAVVAPQLYMAVGISGAIQHLAGMKDSKVIAAVNKDPDAPIFQVADVGLVGDLYEVLPEVTSLMNAQAEKGA